MNRDGIAEPPYPNAPETPRRGEVHVWRIELPASGGRKAAREALREILGSHLGESAAAVKMTIDDGGKPRLASSSPPLSFNLSHSAGLALVAVAAGEVEVGIDVELLRPRRDLVRLAERWLAREDAEAVARAPAGRREGVFYAAWTRHEARAKCTGAGLAGPVPGEAVVARDLPIDAGYAAAIAFDLDATGGVAPEVRMRDAMGGPGRA
jgi:hypothetical protein